MRHATPSGWQQIQQEAIDVDLATWLVVVRTGGSAWQKDSPKNQNHDSGRQPHVLKSAKNKEARRGGRTHNLEITNRV